MLPSFRSKRTLFDYFRRSFKSSSTQNSKSKRNISAINCWFCRAFWRRSRSVRTISFEVSKSLAANICTFHCTVLMHQSIPAVPIPPPGISRAFAHVLIPGVGHLPSILVPPRGIWETYLSPPPGICHLKKINANARGLARGGGDGHRWNWLMHKGIVAEQIARFVGNFARNFMNFGQMIDKRWKWMEKLSTPA